MITIYHNPRCGKSREGLSLLEKSGKEFEIIQYLKEVPTAEELKSILKLLGISPIELVRQKEEIWVQNFKGKTFSDEEIIKIMIENPILIERPIVINGKTATIGRPPEKILEIL
ncbi:arsenate reductase (glutaredoxin) [Flavobacterium microcysteis]|uniref:Arsenate reductase (Glutaredoxin) n=1 Tax=Flavobacterium microcysteis TaxID=2596891 RepID=A0A501QE62_9FLAO|nr:arsenate reductase (glutaredoxin) [Flavobacterium microcysteis]TPD70642.1 arsenate reductase (glutaredoxin) [Flavobacterium microcysteis]